MGIKVATLTTYACDICLREYADQYAHGANAIVTINISAKSYDGTAGGATHKEWWCGLCIAAIEKLKEDIRRKYYTA